MESSNIFNKDSLIGVRKWAGARFPGIPEEKTENYELEVLSAWGSVQKNNRYGRPLQMGGKPFERGMDGKTYERGLNCHAPTVLRIRSERPIRGFSAIIGVDDALQWDVRDYPSGPLWPKSIVIAEDPDGRELFRTEVISNGSAIETEIPLHGLKEFLLKINGAIYNSDLGYLLPDGENAWDRQMSKVETDEWCDIDLADAKVTYEDGDVRYLDEMPMSMGIMKEKEEFPFDFIYDGRSFRETAKDWRMTGKERILKKGQKGYALTYIDDRTGLEVRCETAEYDYYPVVEWTLYFKNTGNADTPILEGIKALDMDLERGKGTEYLLHYSLGSTCRLDDFRPVAETIPQGATRKFRCATGFSSDPHMPYFNIEDGAGEGVIASIGWPGQWAAKFRREGEKGLHITAGQETTRFYLEPGEEARSPLISLMLWRGDWAGAQNQWRRWMMEWNMPLAGGENPEPILAGMSDFVLNFKGKTGENQIEFIDRYKEEKIGINAWWMDFQWHSADSSVLGQYNNKWEADPERFPEGLKSVSDHAYRSGIKDVIVWFAPEAMNFDGHTEWLIWGTSEEPLQRGYRMRVLDFGNKDALEWLIDSTDKVIKKEGISVYRIDSGCGMLPIWMEKDTPDRMGISENQYITGYLRFFDELLERNPGLRIDNCCRGGRRLDLETCRRTVPLWRTDFSGNSLSNQCQTYGLSLWLPYSGTSAEYDTYDFRSSLCPSILLGFDVRDKRLDYDQIRKMTGQWKEISSDFFGDFYPLTPYSCEDSGWFALQFNTPEKGTGFVEIIRRSQISRESPETNTMNFKLRGLEKNAEYAVKNMDFEEEKVYTGEELSERGIHACAPLHTALLFSYRMMG